MSEQTEQQTTRTKTLKCCADIRPWSFFAHEPHHFSYMKTGTLMRQVIIRHDNALARPLTSYGPVDCVEVIVTNLPFGGMEADGIEQNFPASFRTRETADLFLVLIMRSLKERGRAAVVLPDGFLFGEGIKAGNYNLDLKNPHNADTGPGPGPGPGPGKVEDLPEYEKLLGQITETRSALKAQLMDALNR